MQRPQGQKCGRLGATRRRRPGRGRNRRGKRTRRGGCGRGWRRPGGQRKGRNALKERFLASEAFQPLYDDAYTDFYQQLYGSGTAADLLSQIAAVVPSSDGLTQAQMAEQTDTLRTFIQQRTEALKDQV